MFGSADIYAVLHVAQSQPPIVCMQLRQLTSYVYIEFKLVSYRTRSGIAGLGDLKVRVWGKCVVQVDKDLAKLLLTRARILSPQPTGEELT